MVASELPLMPQLPAGPTPTVGALSTVTAAHGDTNAEFSTVLTQLLDIGAAAAVPQVAPAASMNGALQDDNEDTSGELPASGIDAAALQMITGLPVVADAMTGAAGARVTSANDASEQATARLTTVAANTAAALLVNAQLQAATAKVEVQESVELLSRSQGMLAEAKLTESALQASPNQGQSLLRAQAQAQVQASKESLVQSQLQALPMQAVADTDGSGSALSSDAQDSHGQDSSRNADLGMNSLSVATTSLAGESRTELQVQSRVGTPAWREEVAAKLTWMIDRGVQHGTLRLSPENLGPMEVRITTQNDQVSVWFGAAHADTRAALENALPRLREMFAAQGMLLADAGVFHDSPKDSSRDMARSYPTQHGELQLIASVDDRAVARRDGLLDAYA